MGDHVDEADWDVVIARVETLAEEGRIPASELGRLIDWVTANDGHLCDSCQSVNVIRALSFLIDNAEKGLYQEDH